MHTEFWQEYLYEKDCLEDPGVDKMTIKINLEEINGEY